MDASAIASREAGLHKDLSRPQIVMIGLGGAIGTGLFMGSGLAIGYAGPAVILSYAIAAFAALVMVFSLSEMAVVHPTAGSFGTYAEIYLNPWAGFVVRYTYWIAQVIAIGGEAVAAGLYMTFWFPGHAGVDVVAGLLLRAAVFQLALREQLRHRSSLGSRSSRSIAIVLFIILGAATHLRLWHAGGRLPQSHAGSRAASCRKGVERRVDGGDRRHLRRSTASR